MAGYYAPEHLGQFGSIAQGSPELAEKFFAWYNAVFAEGALGEREKALIALGVAHAVQCPYCIDAYTQDVPGEGRRPRADDRGRARGRRHPRRGLARPRRADARARAARRDGVVTPPARPIESVADLDLASPAAGPKGTRSLRARASPLAPPAAQLRLLEALPLGGGSFEAALAGCGWPGLRPAALEIFQINVGRLCNMTCRHCHVDAGPDRVAENMDRETIDLCLAALDRTTAHTVDITGGAPELNPHFRYLVEQAVARGKHVIDRCNLTILLLPRYRGPPRVARRARRRGRLLPAPLPAAQHRRAAGRGHVRPVDRGAPAAERRRLRPGRPAATADARQQSRRARSSPARRPRSSASGRPALARQHGVTFDRLFTLANMPISRFLDWLVESGQPPARTWSGWWRPSTRRPSPGLMCRNTISVGWDGTLYDCDFNQMLELPVEAPAGRRPTSATSTRAWLAARRIRDRPALLRVHGRRRELLRRRHDVTPPPPPGRRTTSTTGRWSSNVHPPGWRNPEPARPLQPRRGRRRDGRARDRRRRRRRSAPGSPWSSGTSWAATAWSRAACPRRR